MRRIVSGWHARTARGGWSHGFVPDNCRPDAGTPGGGRGTPVRRRSRCSRRRQSTSSNRRIWRLARASSCTPSPPPGWCSCAALHEFRSRLVSRFRRFGVPGFRCSPVQAAGPGARERSNLEASEPRTQELRNSFVNYLVAVDRHEHDQRRSYHIAWTLARLMRERGHHVSMLCASVDTAARETCEIDGVRVARSACPIVRRRPDAAGAPHPRRGDPRAAGAG